MSTKQRINLLENWKEIDKELAGKLRGIFDIRNSLAHNYMESEILYRNKPIFQYKNFELFKNDIQESWNALIIKYNEITDHYDFSTLIQEIKDFQQQK